ncbi:ATP-binding cassette domain-containing protein [Bradyrhizobium pachyrhizi]|uniref:ATP-binding cassette domain-containing protein n=1 Tax=Bradyrhizobium pachyrhizi TaxID=280333 RepID=A0A844SJS9_9BRAD|nr:sugar ABC transporter ATP-binding protein [Bradyrhizobium pachyrhizi]MVT66087.1 ATP-binding cassette domain-containing protein [Bradyrhizobium pachyrhizi]
MSEALVNTPRLDPEGAREPILVLRGITKRFQGVTALRQVDFDLRAGEVHVLFGENGAGKSTLINIIAGTFAPDEGAHHLSGSEMRQLTPKRARLEGISAVFQEFSLAPNLNVLENIFLGREIRRGGILDRPAMRRRACDLITDLGFDIDPDRAVGTLSRAHQQMVEIAKALLAEPRILILDEPTASLTEREAARLFDLVAALKRRGVGIIYVSHRMREIKALADRITVLRDGQHVRTLDASGVSEADLIELMTGRKIDGLFPSISHKPSAVAVELRGFCAAGGLVREVDLVARRGEITGIAGLVGCGKSELVRAIYGLEPIEGGEIRISDELQQTPSARRGLQQGIIYFPANRATEGLALPRPVRENVSMTSLDIASIARWGLLDMRGERSLVRNAVERMKLRPPGLERPASKLSGGNRQKVMLARGLMRELSIFLFDEPTVGIDVGAKREVYDFIGQLLEQGAAVILVSSELPEVLALSNRLYVMHHGRIVRELQGEEKTEQNVLAAFFSQQRAHDGEAA